MLLHSLRLQNIRSYVDARLEFQEGSMLLSGDIGSGKSSILLAIEFALFGSSRPDLPAESLLRHGCTKGNVELTFSLPGKVITIFREIKKDKLGIKQMSGSFIINNVKKELMPVELKSEIISLLQYPDDVAAKNKNYIYRYTVYTPQEEMKQILIEDSEIRVDVLRKIFNVDRYKVIRENTQIYLRQLRVHASVLASKTEFLEEEKKKKEELLQELKAQEKDIFDLEPLLLQAKEKISTQTRELTALEKQQGEFIQAQHQFSHIILLLLEKEKQMTALSQQQEKMREKLASFIVSEISLEELQKEIISLEKEKNDLLSQRAEIIQKTRSLQQQIVEMQHELSASQQETLIIKEKEVVLQKLREEINDKKEWEEKKAKIEELLEKVLSLISKNKTILEQANKVKKKISALERCPTCLQEISKEYKEKIIQEEQRKALQAENLLVESEKQRSLNLQQKNEAESRIIDILNKQNKITRTGLELEHLKARQKEAEQKKEKIRLFMQDDNRLMNELSMLEKTGELQKKEQIIQEKRELSRKMIEKSLLKKQLLESECLLSQYGLDLNILLQQKQGQEALLKTRTDQQPLIIQKKEEITFSFEEEKKLAVKKAQLQAHFASLQKITQEQEEKIKRQVEEKNKLTHLQELSHWLEEYFLNLTCTIEKHVMITIHKAFNELFQEWFSTLIEDQTLSARIDDSFDPVIEQNGYETSFANLSGGEKTSCALAYRLALNRVINDVIHDIKTKDLLILDEPTDGFSELQLDKMRDVLEKLNLKQILIVSHESKIESFVENVIKIKKEGHVSSVIV